MNKKLRIFLAGLGSFLTVYALIKTSMDFSAIIGFMGLMENQDFLVKEKLY